MIFLTNTSVPLVFQCVQMVKIDLNTHLFQDYLGIELIFCHAKFSSSGYHRWDLDHTCDRCCQNPICVLSGALANFQLPEGSLASAARPPTPPPAKSARTRASLPSCPEGLTPQSRGIHTPAPSSLAWDNSEIHVLQVSLWN